MQSLSIQQARHLHLLSSGFPANTFGKGKAGTLNTIEHLGYIQIDTISVVERAHHHTLFSRVKDYKAKLLDDLVEEKKVFEYWSHAAAYLPMRDYRFSLPRKNKYNKGHWSWYNNKKMLAYVYDRIKAEGPLQSRHFEEEKKTAGWWNWKETKQALEQHFMQGTLMISKRVGFQKVYDLTENVLPASIITTEPTEKEFARHLVENAIKANGFVTEEEVAYLRKGAKENVSKAMKAMAKEGLIVPVKIEGAPKTYFTTEANLALAEKKIPANNISILSPFDNAVIQRKRIIQLFGFDYTIECYVPEPKRKYGYFCLPILYGDKFVARADCKAERENGRFIIRNLHFEEGFKITDRFIAAFAKAVKGFATFNKCKVIALERANVSKVVLSGMKKMLAQGI
jgi:uncharacterized protein YcaQ